MFKIPNERIFWWPVIWDTPVDGGKVQKAEFEARFRLVGLGELRGVLDGIVEAENADGDFIDRAHKVVSDIVLDWRGVADADGQAMEFSSDNLKLLLSVPIVFAAIVSAYRNCLGGVPAKSGD